MNIRKATESYEIWLEQRTPLIAEHVAIKHAQMAAAPFPFLRATFYRWAQRWPELAGDAAKGPSALAVGDLHIENFGTWRDAEGRLIWGVNDFDETYELPYTFDLARLAASVMIARMGQGITISARDACAALLKGYRQAIAQSGGPFVLGEHHTWLSALAHNELRNPVTFWQRLHESPSAAMPIPSGAKAAIERLLPEETLKYQVVQRVKGLGSLGHRRYIALAQYRGGNIAREAKSLATSACAWAWDHDGDKKILYSTILARAVRCPDPLVRVEGSWLSRRLAPDCSRIELGSLAHVNDESRLLAAMGFETANIHLGTEGAAKEIRQDLKSRPKDWLRELAKKMVKATLEDFEEWRLYETEKSEDVPTKQEP